MIEKPGGIIRWRRTPGLALPLFVLEFQEVDF
jgi:hypothetical protein